MPNINHMEYNPAHIDNEDIPSLLVWYMDSGVDETTGSEAVDRFSLSGQPIAPLSTPSSRQPAPARPAPALLSAGEIAQDAQMRAASCKNLTELEEMIGNFDGCRLKKTATHTVFSDGNPDSSIMVIGDMPHAREDRQGKPFAGESGQLLDRMFKAIDLDRKEDFYLTNILPWRPPGNRKPTHEEITICVPLIKRHIELFDPELIILFGSISANTLLNSTAGIARLRGKWKEYDLRGRKIPVRALFHPTYLLKQPRAKGSAWQDLLEIRARIEE